MRVKLDRPLASRFMSILAATFVAPSRSSNQSLLLLSVPVLSRVLALREGVVPPPASYRHLVSQASLRGASVASSQHPDLRTCCCIPFPLL